MDYRHGSSSTKTMFSLGVSSILLLLSRVSWVAADDVNFTLDIANDVVAPDGFDRAGVIVNGIFPGTIIQANKDDVLHITANNLLTDPTMRFVIPF